MVVNDFLIQYFPDILDFHFTAKVEEEFDVQIYKYFTGAYNDDFNSANALKNDLRKKGFPNAFVFATENGERIPLEQGLSKQKK